MFLVVPLSQSVHSLRFTRQVRMGPFLPFRLVVLGGSADVWRAASSFMVMLVLMGAGTGAELRT